MLKKQHLLNVFALIFLLAFLIEGLSSINSFNNAVENFSKEKSNKNYPYKISGIAKVGDGDSIKINNQKIRLLGIDAPEYAQKCFDENEEPYDCGIVSQKFLIDLVDGKNVDCNYQEKDIYGRYLAYCFLEKTSISNEILANGMAVIYNFKYAKSEEIKLEKQAQNKKIGIWRGAFELPKDYRKRTKK